MIDIFYVCLLLATFLCSLVAGFLFAFAVVAMPGIKSLSDGAFIRAFQVMDRVIQNNQPLFMLVWAGSVIALIASLVLGIGSLVGTERLLLIVAALLYLLGVQVPTVAINIPLNNQLQKLDAEAMDATTMAAARAAFEPRWNRWNAIRTTVACLASVLLIVLIFML
jgi:uncharacterized membrane protein